MNNRFFLKYAAALGVLITAVFLSGVSYGSFSEEKENFEGQENKPSKIEIARGKVQTAFQDYLKTKGVGDPIELVVGCGQKHKPLTVAGNPHGHAGAFTIDRGAGNSIHYQITHPHVKGSVLHPAFFPALPDDSFDKVTFEHLNTCLLCTPKERGIILGQTRRILKPGGRFIFLSGGLEHRCLTAEKATTYLRWYGFNIVEASFMKKLPTDEALKGFDTLSQQEKFSLVWTSLNTANPTLWRILSPQDRERFSDKVYQDYVYLKLIATKPVPVHHDRMDIDADEETERTLPLEGSDDEFEDVFETSDTAATFADYRLFK